MSQRRQFLTKNLDNDRGGELFGNRIEDFLRQIETAVDSCVRGMLSPNHFLLFTETLFFFFFFFFGKSLSGYLLKKAQRTYITREQQSDTLYAHM